MILNEQGILPTEEGLRRREAEELRRWAVEQAVKVLEIQYSRTPSDVVEAARVFESYVTGEPDAV